MCYFRRQSKIAAGITASIKPTIYVDASLVIRSFSCCVRSRVPQLLRVCCCLSRAGFNVVVVCDAETRHHSKRSTTRRSTEYLTNKINYMKIKASLQSLRQQIASEDSGNTQSRRSEIISVSQKNKQQNRMY